MERYRSRRRPSATADPPFGKTVFVDILPRGAVAPIRILPSTRANYTSLPGAGTTSTENFRRLGAFIHQHNPQALEAESAGFFLDDEMPLMFRAAREFADYDSQYTG